MTNEAEQGAQGKARSTQEKRDALMKSRTPRPPRFREGPRLVPGEEVDALEDELADLRTHDTRLDELYTQYHKAYIETNNEAINLREELASLRSERDELRLSNDTLDADFHGMRQRLETAEQENARLVAKAELADSFEATLRPKPQLGQHVEFKPFNRREWLARYDEIDARLKEQLNG